MHRFFSIAFFTLYSTATNLYAQFYHKDIVSPRLARAENAVLIEQKIRTVLIHSFEGDGSESKDFVCEKKISKDFQRIETFTKAPSSGESLLISTYNTKGLLMQSVDSSEITVSTSMYQYDSRDNIISIVSSSHSSDDDFKTSLTEEHKYTYNEKGQPIKMWRIKNRQDSVLIDFLLDENGNVTDEIEPGKRGKHYYYYYDTQNRLTDIVQFNVIKKALLPDFSFEYDDEGHIEQMITVEEGVSGDYFTWKYIYNNGLRIIEKCFNRQKVLLGYFEYEYK
jgi:hypothetical protein